MRSLLLAVLGIVLGVFFSFLILTFSPQTLISLKSIFIPEKVIKQNEKEIIGFLPYWLVGKAKPDYSDTITNLTYFGLTIGTDGHIQYLANEQEEEPGWHTLKSDKFQSMLSKAKKAGMTRSLLVFSGDADAIDTLISSPQDHAKNLASDTSEVMKRYDFTDLNVDIESTTAASDGARENFTLFAKTLTEELKKKTEATVTFEITGSDLIKKNLINPKDIARIADFVVIMAYDFHYQGSPVTGPVAPIGGGGSEAEFDTNIVLSQAYKMIPREKIILGLPSYGYGWETLHDTPRSATLPGSGLTISSDTAQAFLKTCSTCSAMVDKKAQENYVIYKDTQTGTFHQMYYPGTAAVGEKVTLITKNNLAGLAIWALGYEASNLYTPIQSYKKSIVDITRL